MRRDYEWSPWKLTGSDCRQFHWDYKQGLSLFIFIETSRNMQIYRSLLLNSYNYLTNIIVVAFY